MKKSIIALAVMAASFSAFANSDYAPPTAPADPSITASQTQSQTGTNTQDQSNTSNNTNSSTATTGPNTANGGASDAQGGQSSAIGVGEGGASSSSGGSSRSSASTGPSYAANGDQVSTFSSKMLSLPQPVWTQVPTAFGCIVTTSKAGALGWNFVSGSSTTQQSEVVCTTIRMAESASAWCQYESAAFLNKRAYEQMYEGESGDFFLKSGKRDLSFEECEKTKRPVMIMERQIAAPPPPVEQHINIDNGSNCAAPAPVKRPHKYTPVPKKVCK